MTSHVLIRWLTIMLVAAVVATAAPPVLAAPASQAPTVTIIVLGFVDVAGGNDPQCPGCNGEFDPEDQQAAELDPLPGFGVIVRDAQGQELARETTQPLAGLQRVSIDVPEDVEFEVALEADPNEWFLCPSESRTRTLTSDDFQLGNALVEFHFWKGCPAGQTPTPVEPTVTPGGPTVTPGGPTVTPVPEPTSKPKDDDDDDKKDEPRAQPDALGSIRGLAFIDENQDGILGPEEPGLNDVGVHLHGGGIQLFAITNGLGQFSFDGLGPGQYDVFIDPGAEWTVTTAKKYPGVTVVGGEATMGIDFGLMRDGAAVEDEPSMVVPAPGAGIRLPATGVANLSTNQMMGMLALLLAGLAFLGFSSERFNRRK